MGVAFLHGQGGGGQIVTGQITGNDTTTLEITGIDTQPRFIMCAITDSLSPAATFRFLWFDDSDSTIWHNYLLADIYGIKGGVTSTSGFFLSQKSRATADTEVGYYDSINKKIILISSSTTYKFISARSYAYLIGY